MHLGYLHQITRTTGENNFEKGRWNSDRRRRGRGGEGKETKHVAAKRTEQVWQNTQLTASSPSSCSAVLLLSRTVNQKGKTESKHLLFLSMKKIKIENTQQSSTPQTQVNMWVGNRSLRIKLLWKIPRHCDVADATQLATLIWHLLLYHTTELRINIQYKPCGHWNDPVAQWPQYVSIVLKSRLNVLGVFVKVS